MKKIVLTAVTLLTFGVSTGFAAPINNLGKGETAIGVMDGSAYIEHKVSDIVTLGFQEDDIYGQFALGHSIRAIIGSRDSNSDSQMYVGLAANKLLAPAVDGYGVLMAGDNFNEFQVGANYHLTGNLDINLNYRSFMPDEGNSSDRTAMGATLKF